MSGDLRRRLRQLERGGNGSSGDDPEEAERKREVSEHLASLTYEELVGLEEEIWQELETAPVGEFFAQRPHPHGSVDWRATARTPCGCGTCEDIRRWELIRARRGL